jgi:hypothetical protein
MTTSHVARALEAVAVLLLRQHLDRPASEVAEPLEPVVEAGRVRFGLRLGACGGIESGAFRFRVCVFATSSHATPRAPGPRCYAIAGAC